MQERGVILDIRYNAHLADTFDMAAEVMVHYYRAFRAFMAQTRFVILERLLGHVEEVGVLELFEGLQCFDANQRGTGFVARSLFASY